MLKEDKPLHDLSHSKPLPPLRPVAAANLSFTLSEPEDWPGTVPFLTVPKSSPLLQREDKIKFASPPLAPPPNDPPWVIIKKIVGRNHPAKGQYGLYNGDRVLDKGTWIRDYLGVVHTDTESETSSDYDVCLSRAATFADTISIDATLAGNESRYVNDFRNILTRPNAVFENREWPLPGGRGVGVRMAIWVGPVDIRPHEEIVVSYGRAYWDQRKKEKREADKAARKAGRHAPKEKPKFQLEHRVEMK
ncbi:hypothetical protein P7C70_g6072, partial [Phenoliferia sp. Uapishka_3]